jgi:predicted nucleotidyltransferase
MTFHNLRDGDAVVTKEGFIFYVFGYEQIRERYNGFLKYVPRKLSQKFNLKWLPITWEMGNVVLIRPRELYSPSVYQKLIEAFRIHYPKYLIFSDELNRWMITIPTETIEKVYKPSAQLHKLGRRNDIDNLEEKALDLIDLLTHIANLSKSFVGIHGSISLGTHHEGSDIDISIYGAENFQTAKNALIQMEKQGDISLKRGDRFDKKRLNRGIYNDTNFVINATRKFSEIIKRDRHYHPLSLVEAECLCTSAWESVFRPAIYKVEVIDSFNNHKDIPNVTEVVSMIGAYRNVITDGERIRVKGVLEKVVENGIDYYRIVVGTTNSGEYLYWSSS